MQQITAEQAETRRQEKTASVGGQPKEAQKLIN